MEGFFQSGNPIEHLAVLLIELRFGGADGELGQGVHDAGVRQGSLDRAHGLCAGPYTVQHIIELFETLVRDDLVFDPAAVCQNTYQVLGIFLVVDRTFLAYELA